MNRRKFSHRNRVDNPPTNVATFDHLCELAPRRLLEPKPRSAANKAIRLHQREAREANRPRNRAFVAIMKPQMMAKTNAAKTLLERFYTTE